MRARRRMISSVRVEFSKCVSDVARAERAFLMQPETRSVFLILISDLRVSGSWRT